MPSRCGDGLAAAARSPVSRAMSRDAQAAQLGEHGRRLGPHAVAGADGAEHDAVARHQQRRLAGGVEAAPAAASASGGRAMPCSSSSRRVPTTSVSAAGVCAVTPAPGWAWNSATGSSVRLRAAASCRISRASGCSLRCSAVAAARSSSSAATPFKPARRRRVPAGPR